MIQKKGKKKIPNCWKFSQIMTNFIRIFGWVHNILLQLPRDMRNIDQLPHDMLI